MNANEQPTRRDAGLLTDNVLLALAGRWDIYGTQTMHFVESILRTGTPAISGPSSASSSCTSSSINSYHPATPSDANSLKTKTLTEFANDPKINTFVRPTTTEDRIKTFQALYRGRFDELIFELIKAPSFTPGISRAELTQTAASYRTAASVLS
jgi:hypothetical protein